MASRSRIAQASKNIKKDINRRKEMTDEAANTDTLKTGLGFVGEYLVPGGSNLVKGDIKQFGIHAALGYAAAAFIGLPGLLLVSADSLTKAVTGHHLHEAILGSQKK
jgi:hypothetical protein